MPRVLKGPMMQDSPDREGRPSVYGVESASVHERTPEVHLHISPSAVRGDLVGGGPGTLCFPFLPTSPQTSQ